MISVRPAITRALEAAEDGDWQLVEAILRGLLDELEAGPIVMRARCSDCGFAAEWPGLLGRHTCTATRDAA